MSYDVSCESYNSLHVYMYMYIHCGSVMVTMKLQSGGTDVAHITGSCVFNAKFAKFTCISISWRSMVHVYLNPLEVAKTF